MANILFSWLGDLVAQLLYQNGVVAPQRRKWNLRGEGWDIRDDSVNEWLDVYIDGEAVLQQDALESVLVLGDDLAADSNFLRELRRSVAARGGNVTFVGDIQSSNGFHSATIGSDLLTIEMRVDDLTIDEPTCIIILAGREDVDNGDSASTIAAAFTSLLTAIRSKYARARVLIGDPTRWYSPAADFAAKTTVVEALYILLALQGEALRTTYVPTGSLLDEDQIVAGGDLPNANGYATIAAAFIRGVQDAIPPLYGRETPRDFAQRPRQTLKMHHVARDDGHNITFPDPGTGGQADISIAFWYYPERLFNSEHVITACTNSWSLFADGADLILRSGNGSAADVIGDEVLNVREWNRILLVFEDGKMRFYVNGALAGLEIAAGLHTWNVASVVILGNSVVHSAGGWFADFIISDAAATDEEASRDYFDAGGLPRNVIARYLLAGLTDEMGGANATNNGMVFSDDAPALLPGEFVTTPFSPDADVTLSHWWSAELGMDRENEIWHSQTDTADSNLALHAGSAGLGMPELVKGDVWGGGRVLSFMEFTRSQTQVGRVLESIDTADFLSEYGWAICVALLANNDDAIQVVCSNKVAATDLAQGFILQVEPVGGQLEARINIGNSVSATVVMQGQAMRQGSPELISFRFNDDSPDFRLETMIGVLTGNVDNAPAAGSGGRFTVGADSAAVTLEEFKGDIGEIVIFQSLTTAVLDASVTAWRAAKQLEYGIKA